MPRAMRMQIATVSARCVATRCLPAHPPASHALTTAPHVVVLAGMALATLFVTLPFVVRELLPILEQMDLAEEEAAR